MVSANVCMRVWKSNDIKLWARDNQVDQISSTAFKRHGLRVHSFHRLLCIFLQKLARLRYLTLVTYGLKHLHWMKYTPCPKKNNHSSDPIQGRILQYDSHTVQNYSAFRIGYVISCLNLFITPFCHFVFRGLIEIVFFREQGIINICAISLT